MDAQFYPGRDIVISHRYNSVQSYMTPEQQEQSPHFHYQYELLLCVAGSAEFVISGRSYRIVPGSMLFMSNLENHCIASYTRGYERYTLRFSNELAALCLRDHLLLSIFKQRPADFCHLYQCTGPAFAASLAQIRRMEQEYDRQKPYWAQMIASELMAMLVSLYRSNPERFPGSRSPEHQSLIFQVQNYIELNVGQDLSLEGVAGKFYVSKYHLSHCFTQITGYSFREFVITARISKAKDLLLTTREEVSAIGRAVGFSNASSFIRTFKSREGVSPLQYRNRAQKALR